MNHFKESFYFDDEVSVTSNTDIPLEGFYSAVCFNVDLTVSIKPSETIGYLTPYTLLAGTPIAIQRKAVSLKVSRDAVMWVQT